MQNTTSNHRKTSLNTNQSLLTLLSERLAMWDRQDAAQSSGDWHRALTHEQSIRLITSQIRQEMELGTSAQEAEHCN